MPRSGRRRGRGRRRRQAAAPAREAAEPRLKAGTQPAVGRRRRRRGRGAGGKIPSALERMAGPRPKSVQTLPADGIVLEELISTLQEEYGTPTTPQEYRLLIKVPSAEGAPSPPEPEDSEEAPEAQPSTVTAGDRRSSRRRRRGGRVRRGTDGSGESTSQSPEETSSQQP